MNRLLAALILATATALTTAGPCQAQPQFGPPRTVEIEGASTHDFRSEVTGRDYRLFVWAPEAPPPPQGYPVFYVLDGNSHFYVALSAARAQSMFGEIRPAIVVGIGYPITRQEEILRTRNKDLTTPISADALARMPPNPGLTVENTGGLDDFLRMLEIEVKPFVAASYRVDPADQTLFGHSLGGLAVVRALFTRPTEYRTFVSSSPSLFWNDRAVLEGESGFAARVRAGTAAPRILLMAGALEESRSGYRTNGVPMTQDEVDARIETTHMVDNAAGLGARLERLKGAAPYRARTVIFADESHLSVMPAAISRGLQFALSVDGDGPPARIAP